MFSLNRDSITFRLFNLISVFIVIFICGLPYTNLNASSKKTPSPQIVKRESPVSTASRAFFNNGFIIYKVQPGHYSSESFVPVLFDQELEDFLPHLDEYQITKKEYEELKSYILLPGWARLTLGAGAGAGAAICLGSAVGLTATGYLIIASVPFWIGGWILTGVSIGLIASYFYEDEKKKELNEKKKDIKKADSIIERYRKTLVYADVSRTVLIGTVHETKAFRTNYPSYRSNRVRVNRYIRY